jgi:uncharacterized membrane protein HdeD (DUF308 family)
MMEPMDVQVEVVGVPKHAWLLWLVMGILSVGIGIWLLLSPKAAIGTLAVLLAIALFLNGLSELVTAAERARPWIGYLLGGLFLVAGVVVLLRPGKSLWFLALVVGISVITTGIVQIAVAVAERERIRHWVLLAVLGAAGVVVGVLAIAWPGITVWVLALLVGIRLLIWGVIQLTIAFQLRSLTN